jgi:predicted nucleic acid-binding protein
VIAVDTNILVAFQRLEYPTHAWAVEVVTRLAEGRAPWAVPSPCLHEFFAVVTHPQILVSVHRYCRTISSPVLSLTLSV